MLWLRSLGHVSTDDAQVDGHIIPVSAKIYGNVAEVLVNDNQQVKQGQVLVRIDPRDYQAKVDQARAALAFAESQAKGATVNVPLTRETTLQRDIRRGGPVEWSRRRNINRPSWTTSALPPPTSPGLAPT